MAFNLKLNKLEWRECAVKGRFIAKGQDYSYRVHSSPDGKMWWWRYGRNIGQFGHAPSLDEVKELCQTHHENPLQDIQEGGE